MLICPAAKYCMPERDYNYSTNYSYSGIEKHQLIMRGGFWERSREQNVPLQTFEFV